jgi:hypothetical protein
MAERPTKRLRLDEESSTAPENKDEEMEESHSVLDPETRPSDLYLDTVRFHLVD